MSAFDVFQENKKSLNKHLVYSGTINLLYYRGSTLIACDSPHMPLSYDDNGITGLD
jgi:hypothetical protein